MRASIEKMVEKFLKMVEKFLKKFKEIFTQVDLDALENKEESMELEEFRKLLNILLQTFENF